MQKSFKTNPQNPIPVFVRYKNGKWLFTGPGWAVTLCDCIQARVLVGLIMNPGIEIQLEDLDAWIRLGPDRVRRFLPQDDMVDDAGSGVFPDDPHEEDGDQQHYFSGHYAMEYGFHTVVNGEEMRHTGTVGDDRIVAAIYKRAGELRAGIERETARKNRKAADALREVLEVLVRAREWYVNSRTGAHRKFYSETVERKEKRARMYVARTLHALSAGGGMAAKVSALLKPFIRRSGTSFIYDAEASGLEWHVVPFKQGKFPPKGRRNNDRDDDRETKQPEASTKAA